MKLYITILFLLAMLFIECSTTEREENFTNTDNLVSKPNKLSPIGECNWVRLPEWNDSEAIHVKEKCHNEGNLIGK